MHRHREGLLRLPCNPNQVHKIVPAALMCANCPVLSNDFQHFKNDRCKEDFVIERKKQRERALAEIKEESKKQEKLRLLKMLEEERQKLQKLLENKKDVALHGAMLAE